MNLASPASSTPKRKRSLPPTVAEKLSSNRPNNGLSPSQIENEDGGCGSPRTNVAHQFQGLEIQAGSISKLDLHRSLGNDGAPAEDEATRKRQKIFDLEEKIEIPETPEVVRATFSPDPVGKPVGLGFMNDFQVDNALKPVAFKGLSTHSKHSAARLQRAYPSINRLADSKSRARKRMGTPPLPPLESSAADTALVDIEDTIVDPDRASLTWHDDEITGHDPSDPEDDGEGINGIGFKPTPAEARARAERRKQQMADYKSREMKEARAKRSERRREGTSLATESKAEAARKVRFSESEPNITITTL